MVGFIQINKFTVRILYRLTNISRMYVALLIPKFPDYKNISKPRKESPEYHKHQSLVLSRSRPLQNKISQRRVVAGVGWWSSRWDKDDLSGSRAGGQLRTCAVTGPALVAMYWSSCCYCCIPTPTSTSTLLTDWHFRVGQWDSSDGRHGQWYGDPGWGLGRLAAG